ncbi:HAD family hydrolase [Methylophilus flavus]|uniref:HAD family hydrolase n=1 Tax=Methylophilus flavus TaxID=640084 RepID=A0ABW3PL99_9PROT
MQVVDTIIFDLGNVLIRWDPRFLYKQIFGDDVAAMEYFLTEVCHAEWNERQDKGGLWEDAVAEAIGRHPAHEANIRAYVDRWTEMISGPIEETVVILQQLREMNIRLLAMTNWSHESFPVAEELFHFLSWFEGIVVSGREKIMKPDPAIYKLIIERYQLNPSSTAFIDDSVKNVKAANAQGINGIHFQGAKDLRVQLKTFGIELPPTV